MALDKEILKIIRANEPDVTFSRIVDQLRELGHANLDGNHVLEIPLNIVFWIDMSEELCDSFAKLMNTGAIHVHPLLRPAEQMLYTLSDPWLDLPLADSPTSRPYRTPHWLPTSVHLGRVCPRSQACPGRPTSEAFPARTERDRSR